MRIAFWRKAVPVEPDEVNPEQYEQDARYRELAEQIVEELRAEREPDPDEHRCDGWGQHPYDCQPAEDATTAALVADNAAEQVAEGCGCGPTSVCPQGVEADLVARGLKSAVDEPGPMARAQELWAQYKHEMTLENTPAAFMDDRYTNDDDVWMSEAGRSEEIEKELLAVVRAHPDVFAGTWFADMLQEADEARTAIVEAEEATASVADRLVDAFDALGFDAEDARAQARAREAGVTTTFVPLDDMPTWTGMRTTVVEHREHPNGDGVRIEHPERQHDAPVPDPGLCEMWAKVVGDDTQAAVLCATSAEAQARALYTYAKARAGIVSVATAIGVLSAAWECAADVAQYFGETLPDQHVDVQRAAGFRV